MVDVSAKQASRRTATASAFVELSAAVLAALPANPRAIRWRWRASPASRPPSARRPDSMCHPLALTHVDVQAEIVAGGVRIVATVRRLGRRALRWRR